MATIEEQPAEISLSRNPVSFLIKESLPIPDNYKIRFKVLLEKTWGSGIFDKVADLELIPNADGYMSVNLESILDKEIERSYTSDPLPTPGLSSPIVVDNVRKYKYEYDRIYGNPPSEKDTTLSGEFIIVRGGVSDEAWKATDGKWMIPGNGGYEQSSRTLLNWYPEVKELGLYQPDYIAYFGSNITDHIVSLTVKRYQDNGDGTISTVTEEIFSSTTCNKYETVLFPIKPTILNCDGNTRKIEVYVNSSSNQASEKKIFLINSDHEESDYHVMYLNGFFMPGVVRCTGRRENKLSVSRTKSSRIKGDSQATLTRAIGQVATAFEDIYTYRTGYLSKEECESLKELLLYNHIFQVETDQYYPLDLIDDRFSISVDQKFLHSLEFDAARTLKKKAYSENIYQDPKEFWEEHDNTFWTEDDLDEWELPQL